MNQPVFIVASYVLYLLDNIVRELLRSKNGAPRVSMNTYDLCSSRYTVFYLVFIPLTPLFLLLNVGTFTNQYIQFLGLVLQGMALILRILTLQQLKQSYTGMLTILKGHRLEKGGVYSHIRHPGYLSVLLLSLGFGIAIGNIVCIGIITILYFVIYSYRIQVEERMLINHFREAYVEYSKKTYRLIPYVW